MAEKRSEELLEWAFNFVKSRNAMFGRAESLDKNGNKIIAVYPDKKETFVVIPVLSDLSFIQEVKQDEFFCIVCQNSRNNLDFVAEKWDNFLKFRKLCFCFANPDSNLERKWMIYPYAHNIITEEGMLKKGLLSLFSSVDPWE